MPAGKGLENQTKQSTRLAPKTIWQETLLGFEKHEVASVTLLLGICMTGNLNLNLSLACSLQQKVKCNCYGLKFILCKLSPNIYTSIPVFLGNINNHTKKHCIYHPSIMLQGRARSLLSNNKKCIHVNKTLSEEANTHSTLSPRHASK